MNNHSTPPQQRHGHAAGHHPVLHPPFISNSLAIRQEIQRFESVHPSIYAIYDLIDLLPDAQIAQQIRDHVVCIEAMPRSVASNIVDAIEAFRDQMPCGFESMGIPPLAPLNLGHQQIGIQTSDFSVEGEVDDAVIEGLNDFEVDEMKVNMLTSRVTFKMTWKSIQVKSLYDLQAVLKSYGITVEIIGNGNMFMAINDLVISGTIRYSLGLLGGGLSLRELKITIAIGEVDSQIGGLLGNGFVNRKMNEIIEEFIMIAVNDNQAVITSTIEGIGLPLVNNMIGGRTLTDILGSIGGGGGGSSEPTVCIPPTQ